MSLGVYTELIKEVKDRLTANLNESTVRVGYADERLTQDQERICIIYPIDITEEYGRARQENRKDATLNLVVSCMKAIIPDENISLYESESDVIDGGGIFIVDGDGNQLIAGVMGVFPFIEEVLDALNTETDGSTLNPQLVNSSESMNFSITNFQPSRDRVWFDVNIQVRTKPFLINNRREL